MNTKLKIKITIDCLMTATLLLLMAYSLVGEAAHEGLGIGMFLLFILHHVLNISWCRNLGKGKYSSYRIIQTALALLIFFTMMGSMGSGIMISNYAFDFLSIRGGQETARLIHLACAYWGFVLMSLHIGLHWKMMMGIMRQKRKTAPSKWRTILLRAVAAAIAIYGVVAFYQNRIAEYLFLRTHFVFFDFDETLLLFFADYLAIMGLFIWIAYYAGSLLQKRKK
ncbi:MAG: DUF4405 domain-containing protein [Eubacteriales bacterium]|nr:DUF4405 domain-containing protein [Eubacteriales bacterium]